MPSTISAARTALYNLLAAAAASGSGTALAGVQVSWGNPLNYEEQEVVALGGTSDPTADTDTLGSHLDESYVIEVPWKAHNPSGTAQGVDERGYDMAEAIQAVVSSNVDLGGVVLKAIANGGRSENGAQPAEGGGFVIFGTTSVVCMGTP